MGTAVRPAKTSPGPWDTFADVDGFVDEVLEEDPGVKIHVAVDKCGIPPAIDVSSANRHDTKGIVPVLRTLAEGGFKGAAPCKAGNGVCDGHARAR
jgi:hypothetical protein